MKTFLHLPTTLSTNQDAYQLALENAAHGFGVIADSQSEGRGRLGREWLSPAGSGLYCSIILRPKLPPIQFPQITLTAGLALCQMVESLGTTDFGLKWPNDLYRHGKKCGGILVESSPLHEPSDNMFVIVGIGLNVNATVKAFSDPLTVNATSLFIETCVHWQVMDLYRKLQAVLLKNMIIHEEQGFSAILTEWKKRDLLFGQEMQWVTQDKKLITARGMGPDSEGQLLAEDSQGKLHQILSGDVTMVKK